MAQPRIVCAVGPESTGKTTLCRALAARFGVPWLAEYAREHLAGRADYTEESVEAIAKEQLRRESRGDLQRLFEVYRQLLTEGGSAFAVVDGHGHARTAAAIAAARPCLVRAS